MVLGFAAGASSQTYDVGGSLRLRRIQPANADKATSTQGGTDFSWGSGIDVARQARAAQDALKRNDYAAAVNYAQQAAKSAPQNAELWFLAGICRPAQ